MRRDIDLARVSVTDHAVERWLERIDLPAWLLRPALARATWPGRRLRRRVRRSLCPVFDAWPGGGRGPARVVVDRPTGTAFVLRPTAELVGVAGWTLITVIDLASVGVCPTVMEVSEYAPGFLQEAEPCPVATA